MDIARSCQTNTHCSSSSSQRSNIDSQHYVSTSIIMKFISSLVLLGTAAQAHYTIPRASANGVSGADWQFTRITSNFQSNGPVTDVTSSAMTCYERNPGTASSTLNVNAGGALTFGIAPNIYHPGPLNIYMAKAPSSASSFDGKGAVWFKVYGDQPKVSSGGIEWPNNGLSSVTITVPKCIPSGEYLVRFEHIGLHSASSTNGAQLYISCTQVKVSGGSGSTPSNLLSFPGSYSPQDPGLLVNIYYPVPTNYKAPGGSALVC